MDSFSTAEAALDPLVAAKLAKLHHVSDDVPVVEEWHSRLPDG